MVTPTPASRVGHSNRTSASSMDPDVTNVQGENTMQNGDLPQAASGSAITVTTRHSIMGICSMVLLVILPATATPAPRDLPHRASRRRRIAPVTCCRMMLLNKPVMRHAALAWAIRGGIWLIPRDTTVGAWMTANFVATAAQQLNAKQVAARKLLTVQRPGTGVEQRLHHHHHHRARMMESFVDTVLAALEPAAADPIHTGASLQAARLIYTVNACRKERTAGFIPALLAHAAAAVRAAHLAIIAPECIHPA